jgi:hydroxyacylglutathione hydrolase
MKIHRLVVGQLRTNCYLAACPKTDQAVIIDPGDSAEFISEKILSLSLKPKSVILTHGHFDHLMSAEELRLNFQAPILLHQDDIFLVKKASQSARYFGAGGKFLIPKVVKFVKEGKETRSHTRQYFSL